MSSKISEENIIKGTSTKYGLVYLGIPYGETKRFEAPVIKEFKGGEFNLKGDSCPQYRSFNDIDYNRDFYSSEFRKGLEFTYSENCLNLNIYKPLKGTGHPVLFFVHGGNFTKCSSYDKPFNGEEYVKRGVVLVTINYRLNIFGFISDGSVPFNLGLKDIKCALEWVKKYIAQFGGDPDNITVMGQSAGAIGLNALLTNREFASEIKGAILISGANSLHVPLGLSSIQCQVRFAHEICSSVHLKSFEDLKGLSEKDLYLAFQQTEKKHKILSLMSLGPVEEKGFIKAEVNDDIPLLIGTVEKDIFNWYLQKEAKKRQKKNKRAYRYKFIHHIPGDDKKAWHSGDLWYLFGFSLSSRPFTEEDRRIKDELIDSLVSFCSYQIIKKGKWDWDYKKPVIIR